MDENYDHNSWWGSLTEDERQERMQLVYPARTMRYDVYIVTEYCSMEIDMEAGEPEIAPGDILVHPFEGAREDYTVLQSHCGSDLKGVLYIASNNRMIEPGPGRLWEKWEDEQGNVV